jgi:hypothetical protein
MFTDVRVVALVAHKAAAARAAPARVGVRHAVAVAVTLALITHRSS